MSEDRENSLHALVYEVDRERMEKAAAERGVATEHHWESATEGLNRKVIKPPFDLFALTLFPEKNSELGQCIEAMCTNISGHGWKLSPADGTVLEPEGNADDEAEWEALDEFITYGDWDGQSHVGQKKLVRKDMESTGNAWVEIIETASGRFIGYNHIPAYQMRLTALDDKATVYTDWRAIGRGGNRRVVGRKRRKRFRRYVQLTSRSATSRLVWFKELGDPRPISRETGEVLTPDEIKEGKPLANPMYHFKRPASRSPYGIPLWIGNMFAVLGGRAAEQINYATITNNNIPSMLLLVSNGKLTSGTISRIKSFAKLVKNGDNYSRFLVVEADPDDADVTNGGGHVRIQAQPLAQLQKDDAMFQRYETGNQSKIRRAFRLPEALVGMSGEYTANNVDSSKRIADEQVFEPERREEEWHWNRILRYAGARRYVYRCAGPNITDDEHLIRVMAAAERSGAMTPRRATEMLEDIMNRDLPPLDASIKMDVPFSQQMAEAVKNQAKPNEVGQQVTALKDLTKASSPITLSQLRDLTVDYLRKNAPQQSLPGIVLDADVAAQVIAGVAGVTVEAEPGTYYVLDNTHAVAVAKVDDQGDLNDIIPLEPRLWLSAGGQSGPVIDRVWTQEV